MASLARPAFKCRTAPPSPVLRPKPGQTRRYSTPSTPVHTQSQPHQSHLPLHGHPSHPPHPHPHPHAPPSGRGRIKGTHALGLTTALSCLAFTAGALYPPDVATLVSPRPAPPPLDPSAPEAQAYLSALENQLQSLPVLQEHRSRDAHDPEGWYETRPYASYPSELRVNHLTAGTLRGPGKIGVSPLLRVRRDEKEAFGVIHFGRGLCGHEGIVHGGLIATILDESLGRVAITNFPEKIAVTANLTIDYKAPTKADQFVVIRTRLVEIKGRKAIVEGSLEDVNGVVLASARALFIQPKYAKLLNTQTIAKAIGEPPIDATLAAAEMVGGDTPPVPIPDAPPPEKK